MKLIGFSGPAGSGKDTAGDELVRRGFVKLSFAGPLKLMLASAGFPEPADRALKEVQIPGFDFSWRQAAQALGTEWGRALDPDIWTKVLGAQVSRLIHRGGQSVVFTDVRFENEASMIRSMGGTVVHIVGRKAYLGTAGEHVSEKPVLFYPNIDLLIDNTGSIADFLLQVVRVSQ